MVLFSVQRASMEKCSRMVGVQVLDYLPAVLCSVSRQLVVCKVLDDLLFRDLGHGVASRAGIERTTR